MLWQQRNAFQMNQPCGHFQKFAGDIQIFLLHGPDLLHILVQKLRDRNVVDIELILCNQVQKKIQRAFEHRKLIG